MSKFPTNAGLILMLCDDFREDGGGKISLFGIYADAIIVQQPVTQELVVLPSLALYIAFRDGAGKFNMSIGLTGPGNTELIPAGEAQSVEKMPDGWMSVVFKIVPFEGALGEYWLQILLEDENGIKTEYSRTFSIRRQEK
jgi:hypothetical protein